MYLAIILAVSVTITEFIRTGIYAYQYIKERQQRREEKRNELHLQQHSA